MFPEEVRAVEIDDAIHESFVSLSPFQTSALYENCACLASEPKEVHKGACQVDCGIRLTLFVIVMAVITFMTFINDTPAMIVSLRYVLLFLRTLTLGAVCLEYGA